MFVRIYPRKHTDAVVTFEAFSESIQPWPGMFAEPDGSFVWVIPTEDSRYQLDGMIYDRDGGIEYVELKGTACRSMWDSICLNLFLDTHGRIRSDAWYDQPSIHDVENNSWLSPSEVASNLEII